MSRRLIAFFASVVLLCAGLLGTCATLWLPDDPASPITRVVNTDDGISLDESVLDDLRPSATADASQLSSLLDHLMGAPACFMSGGAGRAHAAPRFALASRHPTPFLEGALRPPAISAALA